MTTQKLGVDELVRMNPGVSRKELRESMEMLERLRESGVQPRRFRISMPYTGRRVCIDEDARREAMTARLPR